MPDRYGNPDTDRDDPAAARARAQGARDRELRIAAAAYENAELSGSTADPEATRKFATDLLAAAQAAEEMRP